jgi:hypothetical protein
MFKITGYYDKLILFVKKFQKDKHDSAYDDIIIYNYSQYIILYDIIESL